MLLLSTNARQGYTNHLDTLLMIMRARRCRER